MSTYTKSVVKITPLGVGESLFVVGRLSVSLQVEYADGQSEVIALMLPAPKRRGEKVKQGDTLTVGHKVVIDIHDQEEATRADMLMRMIGFRNASESLQ